ncbi:GDSL-type esterase/lipase family protein [Lachnospiraceae bacterium 46-15]
MHRKEKMFKTIRGLVVMLLVFSMAFGSLFDLNGRAETRNEPIRVACVGDSLTFGYSSANPEFHSYPAQLQNLLGDGYEVRNYGKTSYTLMKSGDLSYWNTPEYTNSKAYNPDIVILMLGINDSKNTQESPNWTTKNGVTPQEAFLSDLKEMIQNYQNLASHPTVYVGLAHRLPAEFVMGLNNTVLEKEIVPLQRQAAEETGSIVLDVNMFSHECIADSDFNDTSHPTDVGYQKLANFIYSGLTGREISMEIIEDSEALSNGKGFLFQGTGWVDGNIGSGSLNGLAGKEHYAVVTEENAAGHSYEIAFTGTRIQVYGHLSPNHGIVKYSVDGGEEVEIDAYAGSRSVSTLLYQASGLSEGSHVLRAVATGRKNASAQNACIQVDYAKVFTEVSCSCCIEDLEFADREIMIPSNKEELEISLEAECAIARCDLTAHRDRKAVVSYSLEDTECAVLDGEKLTVKKSGTVKLTAKAVIPETDISVEKTAVFKIEKEEPPTESTEPPTESTEPPTENTDPPAQTEKPIPPASPIKNPAPKVKLPRPKLKAKRTGTGKVRLSWKKNAKADGYILQMKSTGKYRKITVKKKKVTSYTKKNLKKRKRYYFRVRSYKRSHSSIVYSPWSKPVKIRIV